MRADTVRVLRWLVILLVLLGCPPASAVELGSVRDTAAALAGIRHPYSDVDLPYDVPESARPLLTQLKHQLRDLILGTLNASPNRSPDPGRLTAGVLSELGREGVPVGEENLPKSQQYGGILDIEVARPNSDPGLLAAKTRLQVPCSGGDTSLYIFERDDVGWKLVIAEESDGYAEVKGAQDQFDYAISPRDPSGDWYVVAVHIPGWCTSCWGGLHYRVLRPGPTPEAPRVLMDKEDGVYRCGEPAYRLALEPTGFRIDYMAGEWMDLDLFTAIQPDRYVVSGDHVARVAPVAYTAQEFLNAWLQMNWNDARTWSNAARASSLESWHRRLRPSLDKGYLRSSKFEFVQPCDSPPTKWQIGLTADSFDPKSPHLFFTVDLKEGAFNLESIDELRPAGCPGETPPSKTLIWERLGKLGHRP